MYACFISVRTSIGWPIIITKLQHPLGIQTKDENKTEHMVEIMKESQKYVPMVEMTEDVHIASVNRTVNPLTPIVAIWQHTYFRHHNFIKKC